MADAPVNDLEQNPAYLDQQRRDSQVTSDSAEDEYVESLINSLEKKSRPFIMTTDALYRLGFDVKI